MEHVGIGHFFLDHYAVSLWKSLLSPSFTDSTFMIRIQKLISLRLAGDDLAKEIPSKCYSDPSRENQDVIRHSRSGQAPTVRLCLDKTEGLKTTETRLPAHTCMCQRPPEPVFAASFYVSSLIRHQCRRTLLPAYLPGGGGHSLGKCWQPFCSVLGELPPSAPTLVGRGEAKKAGGKTMGN